MEAVTPNDRGEVTLSQSVLKAPLERSALVSQLRSVVGAMYPADIRFAPSPNAPVKPSRIRFNDFASAINLFADFLEEAGVAFVEPDEVVMEKFFARLIAKKGDARKRHCETICSRLRKLINGLPASLLQRRVLSPRDLIRIRRFDHLSANTQALLRQFELDGRKTRKGNPPTLTANRLAESVRESTIYNVLLLLKVTGQRDVTKLRATDIDRFVETYASKGSRDAAVHALVDCQPLFRNLLARGTIRRNPIVGLAQKPTHVDLDYVPRESMAKLQDLSTVDMRDIWDVRDRMLAFALCYDFALRIGEVARLRVDDLTLNKYTDIRLRPEVQKGQSKMPRTLSNFFPESHKLVSQYLKLRSDRGLNSPAFIVSEKGTPMREDGCRAAIRSHCAKLGIVTHEGGQPNPHRFRHSFGTLNIGSLGLRLSEFELMRRLRHEDIRTTTKIYVTNNPLLDRAHHEARMEEISSRNGSGLGNTPSVNAPAPNSAVLPVSAAVSKHDDWVSEPECLRVLRHLGIRAGALRRYTEGTSNLQKRNGEYWYARGLIDSLPRDFVTKQDAMRILRISKAGFFYWVRDTGAATVVIGKVSLVSKDEVLSAAGGMTLRKSA